MECGDLSKAKAEQEHLNPGIREKNGGQKLWREEAGEHTQGIPGAEAGASAAES
jgi:hypothetical protein